MDAAAIAAVVGGWTDPDPAVRDRRTGRPVTIVVAATVAAAAAIAKVAGDGGAGEVVGAGGEGATIATTAAAVGSVGTTAAGRGPAVAVRLIAPRPVGIVRAGIEVEAGRTTGAIDTPAGGAAGVGGDAVQLPRAGAGVAALAVAAGIAAVA